MEPSRNNRTARPAHATIVAYLALFVALGGTATALKGTGSVKRDDIARGAVSKAKIAKKAVNTLRLAPRSVTTSRLVPGAVVNRMIAGGAVSTEKIADGGVTDDDIAPEAVGGGKIARQAVGGPEIKPDAIGTGKLKDGAVQGAKVADGAVSEAKLKAGAVTGDKVKTGSIPLGKLSSAVVTAGPPLLAGLGRPALELISSAHLDALAVSQPIGSVEGVGTLLATCAAGTDVAYRNDTSAAQSLFTDDGEGVVAHEAVAGSASSAPIANDTDAFHNSFLALDPVSGTSLVAEVFGVDRGAEGCDFYIWSLARA